MKMVIAAIKESLLKEKKNYGLMLLFMIYAFMIGGNIPLSCISDMGLGEYILLSITDHYYIVFAIRTQPHFFFSTGTFSKTLCKTFIHMI